MSPSLPDQFDQEFIAKYGIRGYCPACGSGTLVRDKDGDILCSLPGCPNPYAVTKILSDPEIEHIVRFDEQGYFNAQHPLRERADGALLDCVIHEAVHEHTDPMSFAEHRLLHDTTWRVRRASEHNLDANWVWEQLT